MITKKKAANFWSACVLLVHQQRKWQKTDTRKLKKKFAVLSIKEKFQLNFESFFGSMKKGTKGQFQGNHVLKINETFHLRCIKDRLWENVSLLRIINFYFEKLFFHFSKKKRNAGGKFLKDCDVSGRFYPTTCALPNRGDTSQICVMQTTHSSVKRI